MQLRFKNLVAALILFLSLTIFPGAAQAVTVTFGNFEDLSDFTLNGSAATINGGGPVFFGGQNVLRLTDNLSQGGSAFLTNSFQIDTVKGPHLVLPSGTSESVTSMVSSLGFAFTTVDVSEFYEKGGGSIKCMLCDLGLVNGRQGLIKTIQSFLA